MHRHAISFMASSQHTAVDPRYIVPGLVRLYLMSRTRHVFWTTRTTRTRYLALQGIMMDV
jgi:hypothetical protein